MRNCPPLPEGVSSNANQKNLPNVFNGGYEGCRIETTKQNAYPATVFVARGTIEFQRYCFCKTDLVQGEVGPVWGFLKSSGFRFSHNFGWMHPNVMIR